MIRKTILSILLLFFMFGTVSLSAEAAETGRKAGIVAVSSGKLNIRSGASTGHSITATLTKGSYVTLVGSSGNWWRVEYAKETYGYCHKDYITVVSAEESAVTASSLNVRTGPGTGYTRIAALNRGEKVLVLSASGGWSRIIYHGTKTGYVSSAYLSDHYPAVSLWVRSMKQMDERWANILVAESGKTLSQIGCATTAIAMLESHRTGIVRYPDEMMTLLNYTPGGSVYWPSHYTTVTNGGSYLSSIYHLLKQGKPILFGATNQYGSQHWVVITGFTGGSAITAEKFTIHDPGSYSRTNLQQFLNTYPNFYKYFYY